MDDTQASIVDIAILGCSHKNSEGNNGLSTCLPIVPHYMQSIQIGSIVVVAKMYAKLWKTMAPWDVKSGHKLWINWNETCIQNNAIFKPIPNPSMKPGNCIYFGIMEKMQQFILLLENVLLLGKGYNCIPLFLYHDLFNVTPVLGSQQAVHMSAAWHALVAMATTFQV